MSRDCQCFRELTIQEMVVDPIVIALMRADNVAPEALAKILHVVMSPSALRSEARRLRERAKTATDPDVKQKLAARAFDLAQRAEAIAMWQENPKILYHSIERYRAMLAAGIADAGQRRIIEQILRDADQLAARISDPRQPPSTDKTIELTDPTTSTDKKMLTRG
jgi:hypothetical protein